MKNEKGTDLTSGGILTRGRMRLDLLVLYSVLVHRKSFDALN